MTRTERATFPRAVRKDRSESKSGLDKSLRRNGAGPHNWGSLADETELEFLAMEDEEWEMSHGEGDDRVGRHERVMQRSPSGSLTDEEVQSAKQFRKIALKTEGIDLSAIARTSSAVSSSPVSRSPPIPFRNPIDASSISDVSSGDISSGSA